MPESVISPTAIAGNERLRRGRGALRGSIGPFDIRNHFGHAAANLVGGPALPHAVHRELEDRVVGARGRSAVEPAARRR
jgi:hypothetical protein